MAKSKLCVPVEQITRTILILRGHRIIIDRDLATLYGVETRTPNQAVKRNTERFPEDFRFQLNAWEQAASRSQTVILNTGRGRNLKFLPYAFTEHGAIMAATILNSPRAVEMSIYVVRAFVQLRELLGSNKELVSLSLRPQVLVEESFDRGVSMPTVVLPCESVFRTGVHHDIEGLTQVLQLAE